MTRARLARIGFWLFVAIVGALAVAVTVAVVVLPFYGVYEPLIGAIAAGVFQFALWGFMKRGRA